MSFLFKRTIKIISYSALLVAGLVINSQVQAEKQKSPQLTGDSLNGTLFTGVAHADLVGGGYAGAPAAGGGGGDCGDGGDGACN